jgi:hypothetical protein
MTSQPSIEHKPNSPRRVNTQRAANWFRKPSFPQFKLKSGFFSSSPYLDAPLSVQSSSTTVQSIPSTYNNSRRVRNSPVIVPIMPAVRSFSFTDLFSRADLYFVFSFGSSSSINLDGPVALIYSYANCLFFAIALLYTLQQPPHLSFLHLYIHYSINHN